MSATAAIAALEPPRELQLWRREIEGLISARPPRPAVRDMLRIVLLSLAADPASDREIRRDVRRLLEVIGTGSAPLEVVS